jgi:hypothetical protein
MTDFDVFRLTKGTDEILFGEIVRAIVSEGYPMINLTSSEDIHIATFLMQGTDLFSLTVRVKRYTRGFVLSKVTDIPIRIDLKGMAIVRGATFNHLLEMYKTNITNITKFPFLGDIKVHHDYNRIHVWAALVGRASKYFLGKDTVDRDRLMDALNMSLTEMLQALEQFISSDGSMSFVDQGLDIENAVDKVEAELIEKIKDPLSITVQCPDCGERFDTLKGVIVICPKCGLKGDIDL